MNRRYHVELPYDFETEVLHRLDKILMNQAAWLEQGNLIMATLDEVVTKISEETTLVGSVKTFIQGLKDQIAALPGISPAVQAQIDDVFTKVSANAAALSEAMVANVPPAPPVT